MNLTVFNVIWLDVERLGTSLKSNSQFEFRFLSPEEVCDFAADPSNDLDESMTVRSADGRDFCFAALSDGRLAAYGWYALESIEPDHNFGVAMSYPPKVAYMYKGFTHPDFRGKRLHGVGMALALRELTKRGISKLVSTVDWTNQPSLKSCYRLGYVSLGHFVKFGFGRFTISFSPSAAKRREIKFEAHAESRRLTATSGQHS